MPDMCVRHQHPLVILRTLRGCRHFALAAAMGISVTSLENKIHGRSALTPAEITAAARYLNFPEAVVRMSPEAFHAWLVSVIAHGKGSASDAASQTVCTTAPCASEARHPW